MQPSLLSARATREIARANRVLVSPVSCWEMATLERRGSIRFDRPVQEWIARLLEQERIATAELTVTASASAGMLGDDFPADPADRLLYATARELVVPFVTKDSRIRDFASDARDLKVVW